MAKPEKYERQPIVDASGGRGFGPSTPILPHHYKEEKPPMTRREKQEVALMVIAIVSAIVFLYLWLAFH